MPSAHLPQSFHERMRRHPIPSSLLSLAPVPEDFDHRRAVLGAHLALGWRGVLLLPDLRFDPVELLNLLQRFVGRFGISLERRF